MIGLVVGWVLTMLGLGFGATDYPPSLGRYVQILPWLGIAVIMAASAYGVTVYRVWKRRPALRPWTIGFVAHAVHFTLTFITTATLGQFSQDTLIGCMMIVVPGGMIGYLEWPRALSNGSPWYRQD